jgi:hypothetical protein
MKNPISAAVRHGWRPESGYLSFEYRGYNEAMLLYLLGLGAERDPLPSASWNFWWGGYSAGTTPYFDRTFIRFAPLFGHHYPQCWIDFRDLTSREIETLIPGERLDYFENARRATYANRAYCIANPDNWPNYDDVEWGLTACDGPPGFGFDGYSARGASSASPRDDGTIAPTAAGGSIAYAPEIVIPTLRNLQEKYGSQLYGVYGFRDAYNDSANWFDDDYLGIDQGPILLMIENYRSGLVWEKMRQDPVIRSGLLRAGFTGGWLDSLSVHVAGETPRELPGDFVLYQNYPNPFNSTTTIEFDLEQGSSVDLAVFNLSGQRVAQLQKGFLPPGRTRFLFDATGLASGIYIYRLVSGDTPESRRILFLK